MDSTLIKEKAFDEFVACLRCFGRLGDEVTSANRVKTVCVDINPATVTKLADRGSFQTIGLVTDVEPFLRVLVQELGAG